MDFENIPPGSVITPTIEEGLRGSRNMLMVVTDSYMEKKWTDVERIWFATQENWVGERKFFVVLKGVKLHEFQKRYPTLADRNVIEFGTKHYRTIAQIVNRIVDSLTSSNPLASTDAR